MDFVHLHNHTHYSMLDAAATVDDLIEAALVNGHKAVALTDHGVMFGAMEFYLKASKKGLKPIIGFEAYLATGSRFDKTSGKSKTKKKNYYHLLLLAKDLIGYKNLMKLTTLAHLEGFYYKPRIDKELLEKYHEGIIACSGCINGVINVHIVNGDIERAKKEAKYFKDLFGDDFYIELQNHFLPEDEVILNYAPKIAKELNIKLVVTNDVHYIKKEHSLAHNVYLSIKSVSEGAQNVNIHELRYRSDQLYYKSTEEMIALFKEFPDAIENTKEIADKCELQFEKKIFMPEFQIPTDSKARNLDEYLRELTYKGLKERYQEITEEIKQRADYELNVICNMKFSGYFLIVADFVNAAKKMGVRVGPGRGSAAGSIVAYALGITNIDPIKYGLLFERFLNPDRISLPDIDIDFSDDKRDLVIDYVKKKYGENCVAQIITFGKLSSRAVLKDVGRILGFSHQEINRITSKIPVVLGKVTPLSDALELPDLADLKNNEDPQYKQLIEFSLLLEGLYRHTSIHAAGVVIAPGDVSDYVPLFVQKVDNEDKIEIVTQYSMNELESAGLVKMDFLGLRTLSIIDETLSMVEKNHKIKIDIDKIDFNDPQTFDLFSQGKTLGVFQFESSGMQEYLRQLKPSNIMELSDMNALYRPGPLQHIPEYIDRKYGRRKIEYIHPLMENSLKPTYGIIVYQEQVMQLARDIAGFTLAQADNLRRAMGKKKVEEMMKMKPAFIEGAKRTNGIDEKIAEEIFDLIEKFANYGFNKSHSLAYAILAYQTAWLKAHYPAEFLAANLNAEINNPKQIPKLIEEAKSFGIKVLPPDVNKSYCKFVALDSKTILFGLAGIKNVGTRVEETILKARHEKPFTSFFNFVSRVDPKVVNKKVLEALVCTGAFDSIENGKRAALFEAIDVALEFSRKVQEQATDTKSFLFWSVTNQEEFIVEPKLPEVQEWSFRERLAREKEFLNFYLSGHPLEKYRNLMKVLSNVDLSNPSDFQNGAIVRIIGSLSEIDTKIDKNKQKFAFASIEDFNGKAELVIWSETYNRFYHLLNEDNIVLIVGRGELKEENSLKVYVNEIIQIEEALEKFIDSIHIYLRVDKDATEKLTKFAAMCNSLNSNLKILFILINNGERKAFIAENVHFSLSEENINKLFLIFGEDFVRLIPKNL
ncbi:MAG: DNA polymerase III subunit alpha [Ignavibacteria bacterium]|nr:DNA polymerase III subunit alpha [Ignavibacteria bacterium]